MRLFDRLGPSKATPDSRKEKGPWRAGQTVSFDVTQDGNRVSIAGDGADIYFVVEGIELPPSVDATFAVWALLPLAMEEGFDIHINRPIDPQVAANAQKLSEIWEMWTPSRYRSVRVGGEGAWRRAPGHRLPCLQLYSGGVDATYALLSAGDPKQRGYAATIFGLEYCLPSHEHAFAKLLAKTDPLLEMLNVQRIVIYTNVSRKPLSFTHGFTLAASLHLLSDLFEGGAIAADRTLAQDMVTFPWGTNHVVNPYFAGSDFAVRTIGDDVTRTMKIAAIVDRRIDPAYLCFCRRREWLPRNCGVCKKCIRTKAMFLLTGGHIPDIFVNNALDADLVQKLNVKGHEQTHIFDLYFYAKAVGRLDAIPGLMAIVEHYRGKHPAG